MQKVKIYDAIMGSGKTHDAIERMKEYIEKGEKFIYITPFLDEITRVINELPDETVYTPLSSEENNGKSVYEAELNLIDDNDEFDLNAAKTYKYLNKRAQFLKFVAQGKNIISTHALFMNLQKGDFSAFNDYILILDEVVSPLKITRIGARDIEILKDENLIVVNQQTNEVKFIDYDYNDDSFKHIKNLCNNSTVFYLDKYFFVWVFPIEIFKEFKEIQVLTYLFESSFLAAYFKMYQIQYKLIKKESKEKLLEIKNLLNIYEGRANDNGKFNNSFSKTWCENISKQQVKKINHTTSNIFRRVFNTKSSDNAFTTFKNYKSKFSGNSYSKGFISINARATNDFKHIKSMAYLGNRFFNPQEISFFRERGIILNEDLWALSELIQWVWRGCIRENKPMNLYIPNHRMRNLLINWLEGRFEEQKEMKTFQIKLLKKSA